MASFKKTMFINLDCFAGQSKSVEKNLANMPLNLPLLFVMVMQRVSVCVVDLVVVVCGEFGCGFR
jgi:hypothetical protein